MVCVQQQQCFATLLTPDPYQQITDIFLSYLIRKFYDLWFPVSDNLRIWLVRNRADKLGMLHRLNRKNMPVGFHKFHLAVTSTCILACKGLPCRQS